MLHLGQNAVGCMPRVANMCAHGPWCAVRTAKFVARKQWVVCGADDMYVRVFNYNTMDKVKQFEAHTDYIRCAAAPGLLDSYCHTGTVAHGGYGHSRLGRHAYAAGGTCLCSDLKDYAKVL